MGSGKKDWLFSVADVCNVLADGQAKDKNAYWRNLKLRLKKEGNQVVSNCYGLKKANFENSPLLVSFKGLLKGLKVRFPNSVRRLQKILNLVKFGVLV